jgi:hypothetical protein
VRRKTAMPSRSSLTSVKTRIHKSRIDHDELVLRNSLLSVRASPLCLKSNGGNIASGGVASYRTLLFGRLPFLKKFACRTHMEHPVSMVNPPAPAQPPEPFWSHARKALEQAQFLILHTALLGVFLVCIRALSWLLHVLWGTNDPLMFDRVPLRYFFEALDVVVLLVFAVGTVRTAIVVFRR